VTKCDLNFKIKKGVSVADINPKYNLMAVSAFGGSFPILLYYKENN